MEKPATSKLSAMSEIITPMPSFCRWMSLLLASVVLSACAVTSRPAPPLHVALGGQAHISAFTHKAMARAAADPRTRRTFEGVRLSQLQQSVSAQLCQVADGPCVYEGETMRNAHADLAITGSEFDALVQILREEMDAAQVDTAAKNELLRRLAPMRRDIVVR